MEFFKGNEPADNEKVITEVIKEDKVKEKKKKKKIKDKDGKIEELETKIQELLNEKKELEDQLEFNNKLVLDTKKNSKLRILDLKKQLTEKSKTISALKHDKRIDNVKKKTVFKEQESMEKSTLNQIKEISDMLAKTSSDLSIKEKENITLEEDLDQAKSELESKIKEFNDQKQKLELNFNLKLEEETIKFEKTNQELKDSLKDQQEKMVHEKAVMKILEGRIAELELTGGPEKVEQLSQENEELHKKVITLGLKVTELENTLQSKSESPADISGEISALKTEINQVKLRNKDLTEKLIKIQKMNVDFFEIKID